ncbi:MAG: cation:proton antiporter subunit C [Candidatus Diapherotrites archaeon]|uniref:Cation:proton antiporter subunit C n=1 Tax=Candidatus Iainarchaeum sp. TaxID=3101447 RepID=A0A939C8K2_9ARCH|nr:cation:proton antiporter subunit C [Candidatus Diapherotrites archaeon]
MSIPFIAVIILAVLGIAALLFKRNMVKIVIAINVIGSAANLFLVSLGYRADSVAPIFTNAPKLEMVLPTPQALTLTSIVINMAVVALMLSLAVLFYQKYKTLDSGKRRLSG